MVPYHCLGGIWSQRDKKGKEHLAPTIRATVAQFNSVTNCVITTCLSNPTLKPNQRARLLERWIDVARVSGYRHNCSVWLSAFYWNYFRFLKAELDDMVDKTFKLNVVGVSNLVFSFPQECRILKNFSSLRAILSALQCNAIHRLKRTWEEVSRYVPTLVLTTLEAFIHVVVWSCRSNVI